MTYSYRLSPDEDLIRCEITGEYDPQESIALYREICARGEWQEGWGVLIDVHDRAGTPTGEGINRLVGCLSTLRKQLAGPVAIFTGTTAQFGMMWMLEIRAELAGIKLRAFKDEGAALEWLRGEGRRGRVT